MTTNYETVYITDPNISEAKLGELNTKLSEIIKRFQGKVNGIDDWGSRRLGYKIKKQTSGHYVRVYYAAESGAIAEIEHTLKLRDDVLKQMTIRLEEEEKR
ncbi:MAG: 30S ribosomal protein S6 [Deltaproteobacteria bacterium]|nr:30S ribosomal protein S6 [Deltaproteobacteria bacterium]